jgi:hypothetical protein
MIAELQQDFEKDFTATYDTDKVNSEQAWSLIQTVKRNQREKWQGERPKHGRGPGDHGRHSSPHDQ